MDQFTQLHKIKLHKKVVRAQIFRYLTNDNVTALTS